ncbi:YhcN/YlaJ family sporulation lipoprotein [Bacillus dakarensis]|uniref:YhcN/YlaJ family sporulation lipoprotein n=1 Tax=Robertmurraya dakarensis TaxID=1926278 RepID=UPI0009812DD7|nr:YhcN/YlaJ family sporulation lipoprotein [Bacillus dakarensis]
MKKWLFCLAAAIIFITGCNANNQAGDDQNNGQQTINVKNSTVESVDRDTGQKVSQHLVDLATSIPNVNDATAVVLGRYAIVGIDVKEDIERSQVGSIKYSVAESLKKDPHGARAIVVADPDITARLEEIQEDIRSGAPIQGIINELADISGRLMPEIPADIIDPNVKKNTVNQPNDKLNNNEKQKLENQQEEQSNHKMNEEK